MSALGDLWERGRDGLMHLFRPTHSAHLMPARGGWAWVIFAAASPGAGIARGDAMSERRARKQAERALLAAEWQLQARTRSEDA